MAVYINGIGKVSPAMADASAVAVPLQPIPFSKMALEPNYERWIDSKQLRRMSRVIRMGVASGFTALQEAGIKVPDAIITGTGYGCKDDTGIFIRKMIENDETALNPTPFIQSIHNSIGSQIGLLLQARGYNQTYSHGAISFETALMDALMTLDEYQEKNLLVGGVDEITELSQRIINRFGTFRHHGANADDAGMQVLHGEGAAFFSLSTKSTSSSVCLADVSTLHEPSASELNAEVERFLSANCLSAMDVDCVLPGISGIEKFDELVNDLLDKQFPSSSLVGFKHICGEYLTATGFAMHLAVEIMRGGNIPEAYALRDLARKPSTMLIINQYTGTYYSLILLKAC